jgi:hypothetical protein
MSQCARTPLQSSASRAKKIVEASAKDAMPKTASARGSEKVVLGGTTSKKEETADKAVDMSKWKKHVDARFHLDSLQEQASNTVSSTMTAFIQRNSVVKEVCIPYSPRAPWWVLIGNPSWCS